MVYIYISQVIVRLLVVVLLGCLVACLGSPPHPSRMLVVYQNAKTPNVRTFDDVHSIVLYII